MLTVRSYGLIGSVRLQLRQHNVIESKSEADIYDLRIGEPFPELIKYCESIDIGCVSHNSSDNNTNSMDEMSATAADAAAKNVEVGLDTMQHAHIPYIVILYHAIARWRKEVRETLIRFFCFPNITF